jgi:sporulation protein YlmC with PRC-barrel domain
MTRTVSDILGREVAGRDGELGMVQDVFFDERRWTVRYLVVAPEGIGRSSPLLLASSDIAGIDADGRVATSVTRRQAAEAPGVDAHPPASLRMERELRDDDRWTYSWYATGVRDDESGGGGPARAAAEEDAAYAPLRSTRELVGYHVRALDDEIGRVRDFLVDDAMRTVTCIVAATGSRRSRRKVAIPIERLREMDWALRTVFVHATRDQVDDSTEFDERHPACDQAA